jgi:hypothetical protein
MSLLQKPKHRLHNSAVERRSRWLLLLYVFVTFALATVGTAANAKYSQIIWIDLRDSGEEPNELIIKELDFWINRMALTRYALSITNHHEANLVIVKLLCNELDPRPTLSMSYVAPSGNFTNYLLKLHRCFVIWNWNVPVIILMSGLLLTNVGE